MLMNPEMDIKKLGPLVVLVLFTSLAVVPRPEEIGAFGRPVGSVLAKKGETLVDLLWANCRLEMSHLMELHKDLDFSLFGTSGTDIPTIEVLEEENVQKLLNVLHQRMHPELFYCFRENVFTSPISGDDSSSSGQNVKLLESLASKLPADVRRFLVGVSRGTSEEVAQSPISAPSRSSVSGSNSSRDGNVAGSNSEVGLNKKSSSNKRIIIAVVVTAVVTFIFALLLFACCRKFCGKHPSNDYKDDRPLLSISMSDFSGSPKSDVFYSSSQVTGFQSYGSNLREEKGAGAGSVKGNMQSSVFNASSDKVDKFSMQSSSVSANVSSLPLKPPPGRVPQPGMPALKPPPGRAQPLPPEPPASSRPASIRASPPPSPAPPPPPPPAPAPPPPPAPAPPPPPRRPPSGGAGPPPPGPPPPPPPRAPGTTAGLRQSPLPKSGANPPRPPSSSGMKDDADASRTKLKPFFWDKVLADPDHSMVWHQIKSGSFQFNEEMIESLFGYVPPDKNKAVQQKDSSSRDSPSHFVQLIDSKKAQNLSILLRALNVTTEEVCDALEQGNELPPDLLETLLKMAPTPEEELKLRLFSGELSQLGPAERFLKVLVDIPFAFKRMDALLFMCTFDEEVATIKESFTTLEAACKDLKNSRLFLKLLEAVLKTGNRMNDGTFRGGAQAFKLDTLLKLSDVKGVDGKTTLLHFVVQEIIRSEGVRATRAARGSNSFSSVKSDDLVEDVEFQSEEQLCALGLDVVSSLGEQMGNVKKAAGVDGDTLTSSIAKLRSSFVKTQNFLKSEMKNIDEENGFHRVLKCFVEEVDAEIKSLLEEEKRIAGLMKSTADYFHGTAGKEEGLRLFVIVRDFLIILDKVCIEIREKLKKSKSNSQNQKKDLPFH